MFTSSSQSGPPLSSLSSGEKAGGDGGLIPGAVLGLCRGIGDLERLLPPLQNASNGVRGAGPGVRCVASDPDAEGVIFVSSAEEGFASSFFSSTCTSIILVRSSWFVVGHDVASYGACS